MRAAHERVCRPCCTQRTLRLPACALQLALVQQPVRPAHVPRAADGFAPLDTAASVVSSYVSAYLSSGVASEQQHVATSLRPQPQSQPDFSQAARWQPQHQQQQQQQHSSRSAPPLRQTEAQEQQQPQLDPARFDGLAVKQPPPPQAASSSWQRQAAPWQPDTARQQQWQHQWPQQQQQQHQQQRKRQRRRRRDTPADAAASPPCVYSPVGRGQGLRHATSLVNHVRSGRRVLLPAGAGMQVARGVAALATARTLLLSSGDGGAGLAFQPSISSKQLASVNASGKAAGSSSSSNGSEGIVLSVTPLQEAQLRRFDTAPLVSSRHGSTERLAAAAFARVCQQGFTSVRAAGPDAVRVALRAVTAARRKLLGCGLDLVAVPASEFVDVDSLPDQQQQQAADAGASDDADGAGEEGYVRVTVLHLVRCAPHQPEQLLPWRVPAEQQPAAQQQRALQQQSSSWRRAEAAQQPVAPAPAQQASLQQAGPSQPAAVVPVVAASAHGALAKVLAAADDGCGRLWAVSDVGYGGLSSGAAPAADEELQVLQLAPAGTGTRQPGPLLLQKQRTISKSKRQLVAAAGGAPGHPPPRSSA